MDNSQGLVNGYLTKIRQLSAKHQMGESLESLSPKMDEVIKEAHQHFSLWVNGTPEENWAYFVGQMGFIAELTSDDKYKSSMLHAQSLAKTMSPPTRSVK
ncbi:hypothetical protein UYSO10_4225 [Kosakonia radicincitans]|uniref:hypothetical protein n=1 Tax=Kosakonia radicincitans TaxID=283686 RepID=UPI00118425E7|nr:hypothetical protein [Kosakonia radicincitans]VVT52694.1 hypothetical protein UYSO10_4225 [Kosakonia radicincitans]